MAAFVVDGREIAGCRVAAMRVVAALDEIEDRHAGLDLGLEALPVEQLAFEGGEEALTHGVVETIAGRAHRRLTPASSQRLPKSSEVY